MNKKRGFTLIEVLAIITIIGIIALVTIPVVNRIIQGTGNKIFSANEKSLASATEDYFSTNLTQLPLNVSDKDIMFLDDLIANGYIKPIKDIKNSDNLCDGYVIIEKTKPYLYDYYPYLNCSEKFMSEDYYNNPPVVKITGTNPMNVLINTAYTDLGATAIDITDGNLTSSIVTQNNININVLGTYTVVYSVTNSLGKLISVTRTVNVKNALSDKIAPVITLVGVTPMTINKGDTYTDAGATAYDDVDGNITANIVVTNNVNTAVVGIYTVTYNVSDSFGNEATTVKRTVNVVGDTTPPVIALVGTTPITVIQNSTYTDAGATATDNEDGNITNKIVVVNPVNTAVVGTYTVTYNVADNVGNAATQVTRTINVIVPPVYTFTNAGATGISGPSQAQIDTAYAGTPLVGNVTVLNGIQTWTIQNAGTYRIEVWGAEAGTNGTYVAGKGARMRGDFILTTGTVLKILVGQKGQSSTTNSSGGAGGTFVVKVDSASTFIMSIGDKVTPLIIAGGGGASTADYAGVDATTSECGTLHSGNTGTAKCGGQGGEGYIGNSGGAGGGFLTGGNAGGIGNPGQSFLTGGLGGTTDNQQAGGFGGGGGQTGTGTYAGSAGGGYSGGNAGDRALVRAGGGGGGSYNVGTNQSNSSGARTGHGQVIITYIGP